MVRKRRFGVSLPEDLARGLDILSERLGAPRSKLVEDAVRLLLAEHGHLRENHECTGVVLASCKGDGVAGEPPYRDIIVGHLHIHLRGECTDIYAVAGPSTRIEELLLYLRGRGCQTRFVPTHA